MAVKPLPAQDVLLQLLSYDPETGKLFWKERGPEWFKDGDRSARSRAQAWNRKNAGKEAFTAITTGYRYGAVANVNYLAHRVIWKLVTGIEPEQVDHINGNRSDNRWLNLRDVTETSNKRNMCLPRHNTSGVIGVSYDRTRKMWEANISLGNRKKSLGRYSTIEAAIAARKAAEREHGFHPNHGRAA